MILSEYDRRWAEIRLYQFCMDIYQIRQQSIDIIDIINMVCDLKDIDTNKIKPIVQAMLSDVYYQPSKREIILLGTAKKISANKLGKYIGMSRQGVAQYIGRNKEMFNPIPRFNIDDDHNIIAFMESVDTLKKIGQLGYETTD